MTVKYLQNKSSETLPGLNQRDIKTKMLYDCNFHDTDLGQKVKLCELMIQWILLKRNICVRTTRSTSKHHLDIIIHLLYRSFLVEDL